ncbi:MAG: AbgT family transporter [Bacillota bacterium]|nr:AbgT family transporter [Bacillota bacterium]
MTEKKKTGGFLGWVERTGNKIPHPIILFLWLMAIIAVLSLIIGGKTITNPTTGEDVVINNLLSGPGMSYILTSMIKNFVNFAPLGLILTMTLGIGLAEEVGLMSAFMRKTILGAPDKVIVPAIMIIGICGNIASDAAIIIVPTLAAMIYYYLGKNPVAGVAIGYASTTAGFSANLIIAGTDALLQGITNEASALVGAPEIEITSNWYIMIASTFLLTLVGTLVNNKIIEPRVGPYNKKLDMEKAEITAEENKGLRAAGITLLIYLAIIIIACIPQNSFFRNPETGSLTNKSVLLKGLVPLILLMFIAISIAYGKASGYIKNAGKEVPAIMSRAIAKMSGFIVLAFVIGQFIGWFSWTNMGLYMAISLTEALKSANATGIPLFIGYVLICSFINIFIGSGSAKWALMAPIFVPMMYLLGYHPSWAQFLYRVGDSSTNIISPLFNYFPIILAFMQDYDEDAGAGTLLSLMIPYSLIFLITWILFAIVWYFLDLPLGVGGQIFL